MSNGNTSNTPAIPTVGQVVKLDLRGQGYWTGTVYKAGEDGCDLQGKRGAIRHIVRNKFSGNLYFIGGAKTSKVDGIELV